MADRRSLHGKLTLIEYRVLMTVQDYGHLPGESRYGKLARDVGKSKTDVKRAIESLKRQGFLHEPKLSPLAALPTCCYCGKPIFEPMRETACRRCEQENTR